MSTLLTTEENAAIHSTRYKNDKRTEYFHAKAKKQKFLQLVDRFYQPGRSSSTIYKYIDSVLLTQRGQDAGKLRSVNKSTKYSWIRKYKEKRAAGKTDEALLLVPATGEKVGRKPVFSSEVEDDVAKCTAAWLATATVGQDVDFVVAHLVGLKHPPGRIQQRVGAGPYAQMGFLLPPRHHGGAEAAPGCGGCPQPLHHALGLHPPPSFA
jgi:hypothetical protein